MPTVHTKKKWWVQHAKWSYGSIPLVPLPPESKGCSMDRIHDFDLKLFQQVLIYLIYVAMDTAAWLSGCSNLITLQDDTKQQKTPTAGLETVSHNGFGPQRTISMMPVDLGVDFANNCLLNLRLFHSLLLLFVRAAGKETAIPTAQRDIHCYPSHKTQGCMSFSAANWWKIVPQNQKNMSHKTSTQLFPRRHWVVIPLHW